jgi:hypothetical protein
MERKNERQSVTFPKSLYQHCDKGFINLRFLPSKENLFLPLNEIDSIPGILKSRQDQNIYWGVATWVDGDGSKDGIIQISALWIDLDTYKLTDDQKRESRQRYREFPLKATFIIDSGGGRYLLWLLKQPASREEIPQVENRLKRLASYFHGDMAATDASRILRIPGSLNHKYQHTPQVKIIEFHPETQCGLGDFDFLPQVEGAIPGEEKPPKPEGWRDKILDGVPEGERNNSLTQLAGSYLGKRLSRNEILAILQKANSKFKPPLPMMEVEAILDSVTKTDQKNHPESSSAKEKSASSWPSPLAKEAFYGLAGEFVNLVEPHTEADPAAILIQILTAIGNVIGATAFFQVEADKHFLKIFPVLVGETSKGRKGTSWGYTKNTLKQIDPECRIMSGLSSGEGLIWQVRDEIKKNEPIREKGRIKGYQEVVADPGEKDKRLFVIEQEFASTLRVIGRDGNILSPVIRQSWDDGNLQVLAKNSPVKATGAHISIIGHITRDELRRYLDRTETGNGFANRFLWLCIRRSKTLPDGGQFYKQDFEPILRKLREAVEFGKRAGEMGKDSAAQKIWNDVYPALSAGKPGLLGAVISRAEAQVMRIACIYAILDKSKLIREEHLLAALALWDYSEASARYIFGDATGDWIADRILQALRRSTSGLTRTEISNLFSRNTSGEKFDLALSFLESLNRISMVKEDSGGRPVERWVAV